jgi:hypothetical protein
MPVGNETRIRFAREDHETASPIRVAQGAFQRVREEHLARENLRRDGTRVPSLQSDVCMSNPCLFTNYTATRTELRHRLRRAS